jgi:hypothetical protein
MKGPQTCFTWCGTSTPYNTPGKIPKSVEKCDEVIKIKISRAIRKKGTKMTDTYVPLRRPMSLQKKLLAMTTLMSIPMVAHSLASPIYSLTDRLLAIGDFATFNALLQDVTLYLPDTVVTDKVLGITLTLDLRDLRCSNLSIGDVELDYVTGNYLSNDRVFDLHVKELDTTCIVNYNYDYGFLSGSGRVTAYTDNNSVEASLVFSQPDSSKPPDTLRVENCQPVVAITNLDFDGGVVATILVSTFKSPVYACMCSFHVQISPG